MSPDHTAPAHHPAEHAEAVEHEHPGALTYIKVGVVLTVFTAIEVAALYVPAINPVLVPFLLLLSAAKFVLVVGFYMHLKFDGPLLRAFFASGFLVAVAIIISLIALIAYAPPSVTAGR